MFVSSLLTKSWPIHKNQQISWPINNKTTKHWPINNKPTKTLTNLQHKKPHDQSKTNQQNPWPINNNPSKTLINQQQTKKYPDQSATTQQKPWQIKIKQKNTLTNQPCLALCLMRDLIFNYLLHRNSSVRISYLNIFYFFRFKCTQLFFKWQLYLYLDNEQHTDILRSIR